MWHILLHNLEKIAAWRKLIEDIFFTKNNEEAHNKLVLIGLYIQLKIESAVIDSFWRQEGLSRETMMYVVKTIFWITMKNKRTHHASVHKIN